MMWPPVYTFVQQQPVVTLALGYKQPNRASRRRRIYGRLSVWDQLDGKISPKNMRRATK